MTSIASDLFTSEHFRCEPLSAIITRKVCVDRQDRIFLCSECKEGARIKREYAKNHKINVKKCKEDGCSRLAMLPKQGWLPTGRCYSCNAKMGNEARRRNRLVKKWGLG